MMLLFLGVVALVLAPMNGEGRALPGQPETAEIAYLPSEFVFPTYEQVVTIQFRSEEAAARARVAIAPLFDGYARAISCRWDDAYWDNLKAKERMDAHGIKGTWYLNANDIFYLKGEDYRPIARELAGDGNSIGSHGLSHPYLTHQNRNRMFQEVAGVRIEWEAELDLPIVSHAFSFIDTRNAHEGDASQADTLRSLQRAGLYHVAEFRNMYDDLPSSLIYSIIMPPENQPFETFKQAVEWAVGDEICRDKFPLISNSMHAWYDSPALEYGWDELDRRLALLASFENFWHTNQNAYAAYRVQFEDTMIESQRAGSSLRVVMQRPRARFLNDDVPLTLELKDVSGDEVVGVRVGEEVLALSDRLAGRVLVNIAHDARERVPSRIGRIENTTNTLTLLPEHVDEDFPAVRGLMTWENGFALRVENHGDHPLENLTLTWRLPIQWEPGVVTEELPPLESGAVLERSLQNVTRSRDAVLLDGSAYGVAQLDFDRGGEASRLYLTVNLPAPEDRSFPRDAFTLMGPFPPSVVGLEEVDARFVTHGQPLTSVTMKDTVHASAQAERPLAKFDTRWLHPEIVPTQADWYLIHSPAYILQTVVESPREQEFLLTCYPEDVRSVWLNGERVKEFRGMLREGANDLALVIFHEGSFTPARHSGTLLRLVNPATGTRLADVRYVMPTSPDRSEP